MLQLGLRLAERQVINTTPRPIPLLKKLIADPRTVVTRRRRMPMRAIWRRPSSIPCWRAIGARG
jgi:phage terminase large subunit-like protein